MPKRQTPAPVRSGYLLRQVWRGLSWPAQTIESDAFRRRRHAAAAVPHHRTRIIAIVSSTPGAGATTLTALLAIAVHALHGIEPPTLTALDPQSVNAPLGVRLPDHFRAPHHPDSGMTLTAAARHLIAEAHSPFLLADTPLSATQLEPGFFTIADHIVLVHTTAPGSPYSPAQMRTWLHGIRGNRTADHIIDVTVPHQAGAGTPKNGLVIPYDPALRLGAANSAALHEKTARAAIEVLAAINSAPD